MIIYMLMWGVYALLNILLPFSIPSLPAQVTTYLNQAMEFVIPGGGILANYTHMKYLLTLFSIIVIIDSAILTFNIVLWIAKKIPMLGIK